MASKAGSSSKKDAKVPKAPVDVETEKYRLVAARQAKISGIYKDVIRQLTGRDAESFIEEDEIDEKTGLPKSFSVDEQAIAEFKDGGDATLMLGKMKELLDATQTRVKTLELSLDELQRTLEAEREQYQSSKRELDAELTKLKSSDPTEIRKQTFLQLFQRRKVIPVGDVRKADSTQSMLLNQLFSSEYISGHKDGKDDLFREQREVERNLVDNCLALLRLQFDDLPIGTVRADRTSVAYDLGPTLDVLRESRTRLSILMDEKTFADFLHEHIGDMTEVLDLFNSRCSGGSPLQINLTPYEKGLINYHDPGATGTESYLYSMERAIDVQRRLMALSRSSNHLIPYRGVGDISSAHLFSQLEDSLRVLLVGTKPINNVAFVRRVPYSAAAPVNPASVISSSSSGVGAGQSDSTLSFSYYILDLVGENTRSWKLDPHLLQVVRSLAAKYSRAGGEVFKRFYKDVFGHNDYLPGFETIMEEKKIERWKQMRVLYENLRIVSDEHLIGEIVRKVIREHATLHLHEGVDILQSTRDFGDATAELRRIRERLKKGLPAYEDEPEEYLYTCFDKYKAWRPEHTRASYYARWKTFLIQIGYYTTGTG